MEVRINLPRSSTHTPISFSLSPETTCKTIIHEIASQFSIPDEASLNLIVSPTHTDTGGLINPDALLKHFHLNPDDSLELWRAPYLISIAVVTETMILHNQREMVLDFGVPLDNMIPLIQKIMDLGGEEFLFLYADTPTVQKATWLDSSKTLGEQVYDGEGWLLCCPVGVIMKSKELITKMETVKGGYLVKQSSFGNKVSRKKKRWIELKGNFLMYFKAKEDILPAGLIALEYYTVQVTQKQKSPFLVIKRALYSFSEGKESYFFYGNDAEELNDWKEALQKKCANKSSAVFGVSLKKLVTKKPNSTNTLVPDIIVKCVNYLDQNGLDDEGLLRISGSAQTINYYKDQFNQNAIVDVSKFPDSHTVAGILKLFFRELPEPVIPYDFYDPVVYTVSSKHDKELMTTALIKLMAQLPEIHFAVLKYICAFLWRVAQHQEKNKMGLSNLGTVMGPNLLRPPEARVSALVQDAPLISEAIQIYITNHEQLTHKPSNEPKPQKPRPAPKREDESGDAKKCEDPPEVPGLPLQNMFTPPSLPQHASSPGALGKRPKSPKQSGSPITVPPETAEQTLDVNNKAIRKVTRMGAKAVNPNKPNPFSVGQILSPLPTIPKLSAQPAPASTSLPALPTKPPPPSKNKPLPSAGAQGTTTAPGPNWKTGGNAKPTPAAAKPALPTYKSNSTLVEGTQKAPSPAPDPYSSAPAGISLTSSDLSAAAATTAAAITSSTTGATSAAGAPAPVGLDARRLTHPTNVAGVQPTKSFRILRKDPDEIPSPPPTSPPQATRATSPDRTSPEVPERDRAASVPTTAHSAAPAKVAPVPLAQRKLEITKTFVKLAVPDVEAEKRARSPRGDFIPNNAFFDPAAATTTNNSLTSSQIVPPDNGDNDVDAEVEQFTLEEEVERLKSQLKDSVLKTILLEKTLAQVLKRLAVLEEKVADIPDPN